MNFHYENLPMQYREIFFSFKNIKFSAEKLDFDGFFFIFAQNIDCRYTLEPPRRGGSNEYPQSMFWSKNKKNRYTPAYPSFAQSLERTYQISRHYDVISTSMRRHDVASTSI